jgi:hypothetical protein
VHRSRRLAVASAFLVGLPSLVACVSNANAPPDLDAGVFFDDAGLLCLNNLGCIDAAGLDANGLDVNAFDVALPQQDTGVTTDANPSTEDAAAPVDAADAASPVDASDASAPDAADAAVTPALLVITGSAFTFPTIPDGTTENLSFTITNNGGTDATAVSLQSLATGFTVQSTTCGTTIAANGGNCSLTLTFAPTNPVTYTSAITYGYDNGVTATAQAQQNIQGSGEYPAILNWSFVTANFNQQVDGSVTTLTFNVQNTGDAAATAFTIVSLPAPYSIQSTTCGSSLAGNTTGTPPSCAIVVAFSPTTSTPTPANDTLEVDYDDGTGPKKLQQAITGTSITAALLTLTPVTTAAFGGVTDLASTQLKFNVANTGAATASSFSIQSLSAPFSQTSTCSFSLTNSQTCQITVTFAPTTAGPYTAPLQIDYDDGVTSNQSVKQTLTGTGLTPAVLAFSDGPGTYGYANTTTGQTTPHTFVVTNSGQSAATSMSLSSISGTGFTVGTAATTPCGATLAASSTCNLLVNFAPTTAAPVGTTDSTTLTMQYTDGVASQSASRPIQGLAQPPQCAVDVSGNYYIRQSGTVIYYNGSTNPEVTIGDGGVPLQPVSQVFSNEYSGCALRSSDSTVWCWETFGGGNGNGALGNGTFTDQPNYFLATQVEISAPDGGAVTYLDKVTSLPTGSTVGAAGTAETGQCAIRTDKTLWCWGDSTQGDLWQITTGSANSVAFATQMKVVLSDGGVLDGGAAFDNVDQVSMGARHACYMSAGQVYCWGANVAGNLGTGDSTPQPAPYNVVSGLPDSGILSVHAGDDQTCVLATGGQPYCWGADTYSSNGNPNVPAQICNSNYCNPSPLPVQLALPDGGLAGIPDAGVNQAPLMGITFLQSGDGFTCGTDGAGTIYCWGALTGTPVISKEAELFVNQNSSTPSGPATKLTSFGQAYSQALRFLTPSGEYVSGTQVELQVCP